MILSFNEFLKLNEAFSIDKKNTLGKFLIQAALICRTGDKMNVSSKRGLILTETADFLNVLEKSCGDILDEMKKRRFGEKDKIILNDLSINALKEYFDNDDSVNTNGLIICQADRDDFTTEKSIAFMKFAAEKEHENRKLPGIEFNGEICIATELSEDEIKNYLADHWDAINARYIII